MAESQDMVTARLFAGLETALQDGDEVDLSPPLGGG
jgi:molybdopterin converting factor small subunit